MPVTDGETARDERHGAFFSVRDAAAAKRFCLPSAAYLTVAALQAAMPRDPELARCARRHQGHLVAPPLLDAAGRSLDVVSAQQSHLLPRPHCAVHAARTHRLGLGPDRARHRKGKRDNRLVGSRTPLCLKDGLPSTKKTHGAILRLVLTLRQVQPTCATPPPSAEPAPPQGLGGN